MMDISLTTIIIGFLFGLGFAIAGTVWSVVVGAWHKS